MNVEAYDCSNALKHALQKGQQAEPCTHAPAVFLLHVSAVDHASDLPGLMSSEATA